MTGIKALHKRLNRLESPETEPDFELLALDALPDDELDAPQEANHLYHCGFSRVDIAAMMADRWPSVEAAIARYQAEYQRLVDERTTFQIRKRHPKKHRDASIQESEPAFEEPEQ